MALLAETLRTCDFVMWRGARFAIFTHYSAWFTQVAVYTASAIRNDVTLLVFGVGLTLDTLANFALLALFRVRAPQDTCGDAAYWCSRSPRHAPCTYFNAWEWLPLVSAASHRPSAATYGDCVPCGVPSGVAQHAAFFANLVLLYTFRWHSPRLRLWHRAALVLFALLATLHEVHFGFASPAGVLVGTLAGLATSTFYALVVARYALPYFDAFVAWRVFKWFGLKYENTLALDTSEEQ